LGLFRRERPIHEQLADEAGLDIDGMDDELAVAAGDPAPEWDAVASAEAPGLPGEELEYVALEDGTLIVDDDLPDGALSPLADALEGQIRAPYHGWAFWQGDDVWTVAAKRVQVVEVPEDVPGDEVALSVNNGSRSVLVDGAESHAEIPSLETFAGQQYGSFVLHASRLDETLWEVTVLPL